MIFCGIDSGARATKVVLVDEAGEIVSSAVEDTGAASQASAARALSRAMGAAGISGDAITYTTVTGYGRHSVGGDRRVTEISCHARGAIHLVPGVRTVVDIGGQDSKFISIDEHQDVSDFVMNDRCAAGTGRFLEVISGMLGVGVDRLGELAAGARQPVEIGGTCVVFAESRVVSLVAEGRDAADIAAGIVEAMATRIRSVMGHIVAREPAVLTGGVAHNRALFAALERRLGTRFTSITHPQLAGALGAALFSLENVR